MSAAITTEVALCNLALSRIGADVITSLTANSTKEDRLCNRFYYLFRDQLLREFAWNFALKATPLVMTDGYNTETDYTDEISITNVATSNPVVITAATNYATGMIVKIYDVGGTIEINDLDFEVTLANTASFALLGIDGGKYTTYTSGGKVVRHEPIALYDLGYTYDLPSDCMKAVRLDSGAEFEILGDLYNGRRLLTTDSSAVLIYTSKVTDVTKFSDEFVEVLTARLARELVMPLLGAKEGAVIKRELENDLRRSRSWAYKQQAHEHTKLYSFKSTWADARK